MPMRRHYVPRDRPPWWPANETWPPTGPPGRAMRSHFVRRLGCVFVFLVFAAFAILALFLGLIVSLLNQVHLTAGAAVWGLILLGGLIFIFLFVFLFWAGRGLRRASVPVGQLLEAADRVANGDYSARVDEQGPREVRSVAQAFNTMAARLQTTDEQRRSLLADVTHELRTPLTVIQGNLEGMLDGVYPAEEASLKATLEETQLLARLVDDLRTLTLAESGALELKIEPTDVAVLIHEAAVAFRPQTEAKGVTLTVTVMPEAPLVDLDPVRIRQVLVNLLANALRYTPKGGSIQVNFRMVRQGKDAWAEIAVQDSGPGIKPEDIPYVFDRFYKTRDSGGMGLGLAIAKKLVEAHHGTITATSDEGQGTIMTITVPSGP